MKSKDNYKIYAKINEIKFESISPLKTFHDISTIEFNEIKSSAGIISQNGNMGISKWVSPKRTRSEPFGRVYDTLCEEKRITVIPIQKDEGIRGDRDHINSITLSMMTLFGVHIILSYYVDALKNPKKEGKIQKQAHLQSYVKEMINEIDKYSGTVSEWNNKHFEDKYDYVLSKSKESYRKISEKTNVEVHKYQYNENDVFSFEEFIGDNTRSEIASINETKTTHSNEDLLPWAKKASILIEDKFKRKYFLTVDEVWQEKKHIILQESKNTNDGKIPSKGEVKDALFKTLLYSNLDLLMVNGKEFPFKVKIRLTSKKMSGRIVLPCAACKIKKFAEDNKLDFDYILELNKIARERKKITKTDFNIVLEEKNGKN